MFCFEKDTILPFVRPICPLQARYGCCDLSCLVTPNMQCFSLITFENFRSGH